MSVGRGPLDLRTHFIYLGRESHHPRTPVAKSEPSKKPQPRIADGCRPPALDQNRFTLICEELARTGSKYKSCEALGFNYSTVIQAIKIQDEKGNDSWREAWDTAYDQFRDSLADEATRRARNGVVRKFAIYQAGDRKGEPILDPQGNPIPVEVEYSDHLLALLLKGHFPERFRDNVHHSGVVGLQPVDAFSNLTTRAKLEIRGIIMRDLEEQRVAAAEAQLLSRDRGEVIEGTAVERALEDLRDSGDGGDAS